MSSYERHYEALKYAMETIAESPVAGYVKELYLYGSFSRGDYKWNSDVDLLLTLDEQVAKKCRREIHMLKSQVTRDVPGAVEVDLKIVFGDDWKENNMTYYQNIRKEGKKLW